MRQKPRTITRWDKFLYIFDHILTPRMHWISTYLPSKLLSTTCSSDLSPTMLPNNHHSSCDQWMPNSIELWYLGATLRRPMAQTVHTRHLQITTEALSRPVPAENSSMGFPACLRGWETFRCASGFGKTKLCPLMSLLCVRNQDNKHNGVHLHDNGDFRRPWWVDLCVHMHEKVKTKWPGLKPVPRLVAVLFCSDVFSFRFVSTLFWHFFTQKRLAWITPYQAGADSSITPMPSSYVSDDRKTSEAPQGNKHRTLFSECMCTTKSTNLELKMTFGDSKMDQGHPSWISIGFGFATEGTMQEDYCCGLKIIFCNVEYNTIFPCQAALHFLSK